MTSHHSDILLPRGAWETTVNRNRLAAFVPIAVALVGVAVVLFGGISVRTGGPATASVADIDPVITGSILTPDERRRALELLDR